jgi:hypothetical protein
MPLAIAPWCIEVKLIGLGHQYEPEADETVMRPENISACLSAIKQLIAYWTRMLA